MIKKTKKLILILVCLIACSSDGNTPAGVESLNKLSEIGKRILVSGDYKLLLKHSDLSGIPEGKKNEIIDILKSWKGLPSTMKIKSVEVIPPEEYDPYSFMPKEWPDEFKRQLKPNIWNIKPDKIIVFLTEPKSPGKGMDSRWTLGAVERDSLWYFCAQYKE